MLETPQKHQEDLTKHLREDLSDTEVKWVTEEKIEVMSGIQKSWEKKLQYISKLLGDLQEKVVNTPAPTAQEEEDTYETRSFNLRAQDTIHYKAQQVFIRWKINFLRSIKYYKDTLALSEEKEEEEKPETGTRARAHSPVRPKNPSN